MAGPHPPGSGCLGDLRSGVKGKTDNVAGMEMMLASGHSLMIVLFFE